VERGLSDEGVSVDAPPSPPAISNTDKSLTGHHATEAMRPGESSDADGDNRVSVRAGAVWSDHTSGSSDEGISNPQRDDRQVAGRELGAQNVDVDLG
jgi:hypothetical protein